MSNSKAKNKTTTLVHASQTVSWSGPVPPPDVLAQYDNVLPGAMDRILTMAESESEHRRKMDERLLSEQSETRTELHAIQRRGQAFAFTVVVLSFSAAVACVYNGSHVVAGLFVGTTLLGIVRSFSEVRSQDREIASK